MQLIEVKSPDTWRLFHKVPHIVYRNDPNWIAPLQGDVQNVFNPDENKAFAHGESAQWVLLDDQNQPAGRIAAFIDHDRNKSQPYPLGGIGFFECIDRAAFADALFQKAESWLREKGAKAVDAPINFGERDKFWGLLVHGFDPPLFQENYHPAYYQAFFEQLGYQPFEQILTLKGKSEEMDLGRLKSISDRIRSKGTDIRVESYKPEKLDQYARDFCEVYNASFSHFEHFKPIEPVQIVKLMNQVKAVIDPGIICVAYYEGHPAAFCALFPDINFLLKPAKGRLNWRTIPFFFLRRAMAKTFNAKGIGFGVHPEYQSKGVFPFIIEFLASSDNMKKYPYMYLTTIRAHNAEILGLYRRLNVKVDRVHIAYRKPLESGIPIEPFPFIDIDS
ncbi:MAG: hypothetical protein KDD12_14955 [Lewinella sp.]|nr:hypothetical protein [Lewinella sp.]